MQPPTILAFLLLVTVGVAGCAGKSGGQDDADGTGSSGTLTRSGSSTQSGSSTRSGSGTTSVTGTTGPDSSNRPPSASLSASVANGTIPLNVTFTVSGNDPDGDELTWTLAYGDGSPPSQGSAVPDGINHTFTAAGNYTVVLTVSDGPSNATSNVTITVAAAGGSANSFIVTLTNICAPPTTTCTRAPNGCSNFATRTPGEYCAWFPIPAALHGKAFTLTSTGGDPDATFTASPNGGACAFPANEASRSVFDEEGPEQGTIPATSATGSFNIDCVTVIEFAAKPSTLTFKWTP